MRPSLFVVATWLLASVGCGETSEPCLAGTPGLHFIINLPSGTYFNGELAVEFSNGQGANIPLPGPGPWQTVIDFTAPYPAAAVDGMATAFFYARPDPGIGGSSDFTIGLAECSTIQINAVSAAPDAGH